MGVAAPRTAARLDEPETHFDRSVATYADIHERRVECVLVAYQKASPSPGVTTLRSPSDVRSEDDITGGLFPEKTGSLTLRCTVADPHPAAIVLCLGAVSTGSNGEDGK